VVAVIKIRMNKLAKVNSNAVILGGGLTGLSAGYALTKAGLTVKIFERDKTVGGLSKTVVKEGFRFDLGGHRLFTADAAIIRLLKNLMAEELVEVQRSSKIYLHGKRFDYPLRPMNAIFGLGIPTTLKILTDYSIETAKRFVIKKRVESLEDWVVGNFGRTMFEIYFKEYSEKVWGIDCSMISAEWVAQRIRGLSLAKAIKNALLKFNGNDLPTLAGKFLYPQLGIGRIADRLREEIEYRNEVVTGSNIVRVNHANTRIENILISEHAQTSVIKGEHFISSMPLTTLVGMLNPPPPASILDAVANLRFRDLVIVAIMLNKARITDQTWIYIPERHIPFGRIHEPTNWSPKMAPAGKTLLVTEYFSFRGDSSWNDRDENLIGRTIEHLVSLRLIDKRDVIDSVVVRVPQAYPLFEIGYRKHCEVILEYLERFNNLYLAGRSGLFQYYNMDVAIKSGIAAAETIIGRKEASGIEQCEESVEVQLT
jgi:protoporphyrinogen oxidase